MKRAGEWNEPFDAKHGTLRRWRAIIYYMFHSLSPKSLVAYPSNDHHIRLRYTSFSDYYITFKQFKDILRKWLRHGEFVGKIHWTIGKIVHTYHFEIDFLTCCNTFPYDVWFPEKINKSNSLSCVLTFCSIWVIILKSYCILSCPGQRGSRIQWVPKVWVQSNFFEETRDKIISVILST